MDPAPWDFYSLLAASCLAVAPNAVAALLDSDRRVAFGREKSLPYVCHINQLPLLSDYGIPFTYLLRNNPARHVFRSLPMKRVVVATFQRIFFPRTVNAVLYTVAVWGR